MREIFNKVCEEKENDLFEGRKIMGMIKWISFYWLPQQ